MKPLLEVVNVYKRFGGVVALKGVSLTVMPGERVGLIGPNGAGKTTLFNVISGIYQPDEGKVIYRGVDITKWPPHRRSRAGIARTFQIVRPLANMSVLDNVTVGALMKRSDIEEARKTAYEAIRIAGLEGKEDVLAKDLNLVEKKRLELARALATDPQLLLLDEIAAGLRPREVDSLVDTLLNVSRRGITIIMVEHVMRAVMNFAERIIVLHFGEKIAEGDPREVANNKLVVEAYLGIGVG
ncbi:MAG: ABC transporter ATP-binding protein [Desulfurococcales archaeon]|nr:ABC transporter ATP-binding protein [Desulfurococcales archaeon]